MKVEEGNRILTDFMGFTIVESDMNGKPWFTGECFSIHATRGLWGCASSDRDWVEKQMYWGKHFHEDWRELMAVVKKLSGLCNWDDTRDLSLFLRDADIENSYTECVNLVKKYNSYQDEI